MVMTRRDPQRWLKNAAWLPINEIVMRQLFADNDPSGLRYRRDDASAVR